MEVHTHASTERKRLKHYLFEFFMLFLAVFCGFLAENWREHIGDHHREIRYMRNLVEDLSRDTAFIQNRLFFQKRAVVFADSLISTLNSSDRDNHLSDIYYYARVLSVFNPFLYSNATVNQLKNSGSLRLIKKESVADSIIQYDIYAQQLLVVDESVENVILEFRDKMGTLLDATIIRSMIDTSLVGSPNGGFLKRPVSTKRLISDDKQTINQLCLSAGFLLSLYQWEFKSMTVQKLRAIHLIGSLKREYHLK